VIVVRDLATLVERASVLATSPGRRVLGVTGAPGAGKSTLAAAVVAALGSTRRPAEAPVGVPGSAGRPIAALVPMDGFHLRQAVLVQRGLATVKGAPETFDGAAYVALLRSWRSGRGELRAPGFDRVAEEPVPDAVVVPADVRLVVTEGNYLLLDSDPWSGLAGVLDESWYVDLADPLRVRRLVARHAAYGKSAADALAWATGSDARNAALVATTRERADVLVDLAALALPGPGAAPARAAPGPARP